jgi:RNA polymerase sigma factor (sigma-70 family)
LLRAWRRRSTLRDEVEQVGADEDDLVVATVDRADLQAALGSLSERERVLLSLRYEEDMTQPAIAARLGIPEGTVKVQLHRARLKLRRAYVP